MLSSHAHAIGPRHSSQNHRGTPARSGHTKGFATGAGVLIMLGATVLGGLTTVAAADGPRHRGHDHHRYGHHDARGFGHNQGTVVCRVANCSSLSCTTHRSVQAGVLRINGRSQIITERGLHEQILEAFTCLGYDAWCENGKVIVRYHKRAPRVWWYSRSHRAQVSRHGDCLVITPIKRQVYTTRYAHHGGWNHKGVNRGRGYWDRDSHWDRRDRRDHRPARRSICRPRRGW